MARNSGIKVVNSFNKGLITEATGLNFPDNAVVDCRDVVFDETAKMVRRKGFTIEANSTTANRTLSFDTTIKEYVWNNAAGQANLNFVVVQIGSTIYFYRTSGSNGLSSGLMPFTVNLNSYKASGAPDVSKVAASITNGYNYLFIAHPYCDPIYVKYNSSTSITASRVTIKIRDFEGVTDNLDIDEQPSSLSLSHKYNLYNQGWYKPTVLSDFGFGGGTGAVNPVTLFKTRKGVYPSNADIWWLYKRSTGAYDPGEVETTTGNTEAPKGHYILKAFYQDRSGVSGVGSFSVTSSSYYRPSVVAFFAGRVFYAGVNYAKFTNKIYYSQIIQKDEQIGRCYQANDPTSEENPDLLPSDGGEVLIPEMGTVYKMIPIQSMLIVFASNGVWSVGGTEGTGGFKANDFSIKKISNVGSLNQSSFADIEGYAIWWNLDGIWTIAPNNVGTLEVKSISDGTIKSYYQNIDNDAKKTAKSVYNEKSKVIQWLYNSDGNDLKYRYDSALNFNTLSQCFYPLSIPTDKKIVGVVSITGQGIDTIDDPVVDESGVIVYDNLGVTVTSSVDDPTELSSVFKYLTAELVSGSTYSFTFSEASASSYLDWGTEDYESYAVTGYSVDGKAMMFVQSNYVTVFMEEETNASCFMQGVFDWANSPTSGKYSTIQQCYYESQINFGVRKRKLKVRGKGRSIQLKFTSETGKPFTIIGWALAETSNATP